MRATDVAFDILKAKGQPIEVHDLLDEILDRLGQDREPRRVSQIYTELNMDIRFQYRGNTEWGLKEWASHGSGKVSMRERVTAESDEGEESENEDSWQ